jgi:DNA-binding CsgD family transcriptional regulator/pimeloyl-ACP methyl ester carboxylesterase
MICAMNAPPVQYVTTRDGYNIAHAVRGEGRVFLYMHPFGHLQNDWLNPATGPWLSALSQHMRLVQYDCRGQGMSTRGLRPNLTMDDYELDIDAVVDRLGLDRFVLMGSFWFGHCAVRYAVRNPRRVEALVLLHCSVERRQLISPDLARQHWSVFLETIVTAPVWTAEQRLAAIESFRQSMTQEDWLVREAALGDTSIGAWLPKLQMPTLVLHARDNNRQDPDDSSRLAAAIPNAQFTLIDGSSQLGDATSGVRAIEAFLGSQAAQTAPVAGPPGGSSGVLSPRELEVLRLLAAGRSNQQIANELVISPNTVNRHVSNIYAKTGAANRAGAVGYAHRHGLAG